MRKKAELYNPFYQTPKRNYNHLEQYLSEITAKITLLLEVTHNLKCAAYKMVKLPIENYAKKYKNQKSSILTSIDSIFYDLKRVQTILEEKINNYIMPQIVTFKQQNYEEMYYPDNFKKQLIRNNSFKSYANYQNFISEPFKQKTPIQRKMSHVGFNRDNEKYNNDLKRTVKPNISFYEIQKDKMSPIVNNIGKFQEHLNVNYPYTPTPTNNNPRRSRQMKISSVSSHQYFGNGNSKYLSSPEQKSPNNHPIIKISRQKGFQQHVRSPRTSEYSHSPISVNWNDIQKEEYIKDKQNQIFLKQIKRNRENYMAHINKIRQKCFVAINKISQKILPQERKSSEKNMLLNSKQRSRTEHFYKSQIDQQQPRQTSLGKIKGQASSLYNGR